MFTASTHRQHLKWALELTSLPTAAGREHRVIRWIEEWVARRRNIILKRDRWGNLILSIRGRKGPTVFFTSHLDHPAFVVTKVVDRREIELEFRGGIAAVYFKDGRVLVHDADDTIHRGRIVKHWKGKLFDEVRVRFSRPTDDVAVDDVATWEIKPAQVKKGQIHAPACDDNAATAAALSALDELRQMRGTGDVRVLFTRAEEVGFIGAILASEGRVLPKKAKIIALENSRTFPESPLGAGPIIRVGDRISIFHHGLSYTLAQLAEAHAKKNKKFRWQRKLMPGGACEATAFQAYGFEATCVCLPLGHYHNQGDIDAVQAGRNKKPPRAAAEYISVDDYHSLVEMLVVAGREMTGAGARRSKVNDGARAILARLEHIRDERRFVLEEDAARIR